MERSNRDIALEYADVMWNQHDLERGVTYLTPELANSEAMTHITQAFDAFSDLRVDILEPGPIAEGDYVVLRVAVSATHDSGEFAGQPPSGKQLRWESIRIQEVVNYATYNQPEVVFGTMGFGQPMDAVPLLLTPGAISMAWGGTIRLLAEGLGVELDEIRQIHEKVAAPENFETPIGTVKEGSMAALRFEVQGIVNGRPALIVEHVTRLRDDLSPEWAQSDGGYRIIIEGVPSITVHLEMADEKGDHAVGGVILTATRLVNSIPAVCEARPGLLSALDLPLITGRGLMA